MTLYTAMIEHEGDSVSFLQNFWTESPSIGSALDRIRRSLPIAGIPEPCVISELDPYPTQLPAEVDLVVPNVWSARVRHSYPSSYSFRPPTGVIKSRCEGKYDLADIRPGFSVQERSPSIIVSVVSESDRLLDRYYDLVATLGSYRVSWVRFHSDWEKGGEIAYVNEGINEMSALRALLTTHDRNIVGNGHVSVTAYSRDGDTNIDLTDHKTIEVWTTSRDRTNAVVAALLATGLAQTAKLVGIDVGIHHWHYRPHDSLDRAGLIASLIATGFKPWQPVVLDGPSGSA